MLELQVKLLGDTERNDALYRALSKVIKPGKSVVMDIGSGTGLLSFFAEKLGAAKCIGFEADPGMCELSRKLASENGMKKCTFVNEYSTDVKNAPKVDIIISETLGNFALEEHILETLRDAKRFLKPDGVMIPQKLTQYIAPVISKTAYDKNNVWDQVGHDITMNVAKKDALSHMYVHTFVSSDLLAGKENVRTWDEIDFRTKESSTRSKTLEWKIANSTTIYGFAVWWDAQLIPGIHISTSSFNPPTHWEQIYLPVVEPIVIKKGQTLVVDIKSDTRLSAGVDVRWKTRVK